MAPISSGPISTTDLIARRAILLQKRPKDLALIHQRVLKARYNSIRHFEQEFKNTIKDFDFKPGALVLVRNTRIEKELNRKTKPRYLGPMIVIRRTTGGSYILGEVDGTLSKLRYAAFRLVPYHPRSPRFIPVTTLLDYSDEELDMMTHEPEADDSQDESPIDSNA
jgi:hypothetical protein